MRRKSEPDKAPAEQVIRTYAAPRGRHFSAEDKIRIVLEGLRGEDSIAGSAGAKVSPHRNITAGPRSFWKRASAAWPATPRVPPHRARSRSFVTKSAEGSRRRSHARKPSA